MEEVLEYSAYKIFVVSVVINEDKTPRARQSLKIHSAKEPSSIRSKTPRVKAAVRTPISRASLRVVLLGQRPPECTQQKRPCKRPTKAKGIVLKLLNSGK